jgi:hypothetical protein
MASSDENDTISDIFLTDDESEFSTHQSSKSKKDVPPKKKTTTVKTIKSGTKRKLDDIAVDETKKTPVVQKPKRGRPTKKDDIDEECKALVTAVKSWYDTIHKSNKKLSLSFIPVFSGK